MNDLEQRVKILENKVKMLEETLETIKNISLSEQMGSYIQTRSRSLKMIDLVNSLDNESHLDFDKERETLNNVRAVKNSVDAQISQALRNAGTFSDDLPGDPRYFNYEIEDGYTTDYFGNKKRIPEMQPYVGKMIRITSYNGFDSNRVVVPREIDGYMVVSIGEKVFMNTSISEVVLPKSLKAILREAFTGCKKLKHIVIPDGVEILGDYCFNQSGLIEINCPNSLRKIPVGCFAGCTELNSVKLGNQTFKLDNYAFNKCFNLKKINLPESLLEIGINCFERTKISTLIFPSKMNKVSGKIFGDRFTKNSNNVVCVFLGRNTIVDIDYYGFYYVSLIYCLPGSRIQQIARERKIPMKPLSEFRMEDTNE